MAIAKSSQEALISKLGISHELALEKQKTTMQEKINELNLENKTISSNLKAQAKEHTLEVKNLKDNHVLAVNDLTKLKELKICNQSVPQNGWYVLGAACRNRI